jgi:hypothetical protein
VFSLTPVNKLTQPIAMTPMCLEAEFIFAMFEVLFKCCLGSISISSMGIVCLGWTACRVPKIVAVRYSRVQVLQHPFPHRTNHIFNQSHSLKLDFA